MAVMEMDSQVEVEIDFGFFDEVEASPPETDYLSIAEEVDGKNLQEMKSAAKKYMKLFFQDQEMHCGGKISDHFLMSDKNVELVLMTGIGEACDKVYEALEEAEYFPVNTTGLVIEQDVKCLISVLRKIASKVIPKEFFGGLILLYFQFCEGIPF